MRLLNFLAYMFFIVAALKNAHQNALHPFSFFRKGYLNG